MHERNEKGQGPDLLFLCHRIPYPPDRGDKVRSWHWLLALTECFRVHLAAFMDGGAAQEHQERLESMCASHLFLPLQPALRRARSLSGLLTGEALRLPYYRDRRLHRWLGWVWRAHAHRSWSTGQGPGGHVYGATGGRCPGIQLPTGISIERAIHARANPGNSGGPFGAHQGP